MRLLEVENLGLGFGGAGILRGVSFGVGPGERVALVGESGCGKSMTLHALTRLPPTDAAEVTGEVRFMGAPLRGPHPRISYVFQDPMASLDPVMRIGRQLREACVEPGEGRAARDARIAETLRAVDLRDPDAVMRSFPCELSGGMCQRAMIAMALLRNPALLVADEPTTALDATTQADVMALLGRVVRERGMALLLATHNITLVAGMCDTVNVFYAGQIVESGPAREVAGNPLHPYTRGLMAAVPRISGRRAADLCDIPGEVPSPAEIEAECRRDGGWACAFRPRCAFAEPGCGAALAPRRLGGRTVVCKNKPLEVS